MPATRWVILVGGQITIASNGSRKPNNDPVTTILTRPGSDCRHSLCRLSHQGSPNHWQLPQFLSCFQLSTRESQTGFRAVQSSHSVVPDSLRPHGPQHARPPCPSPTPRVHSNSCPLSWGCHPTISSSVIPFSACLQSFLPSGSFPMSQFFASGGQSIRVSASTSVCPMNIQDWFPLYWILKLVKLGNFTFCIFYHDWKKKKRRSSLMTQWLRLCPPHAVHWGLIPHQWTKPHRLLIQLRVQVPQLASHASTEHSHTAAKDPFDDALKTRCCKRNK